MFLCMGLRAGLTVFICHVYFTYFPQTFQIPCTYKLFSETRVFDKKAESKEHLLSIKLITEIIKHKKIQNILN